MLFEKIKRVTSSGSRFRYCQLVATLIFGIEVLCISYWLFLLKWISIMAIIVYSVLVIIIGFSKSGLSPEQQKERMYAWATAWGGIALGLFFVFVSFHFQ